MKNFSIKLYIIMNLIYHNNRKRYYQQILFLILEIVLKFKIGNFNKYI